MPMKTLKLLFDEHYRNLYLIFRLSLYELKITYVSNRLGIIWLILNPAIQVTLYWVVFGLGIRGGAPINGVPFFLWLLCGLIPWFYISAGIIQGSKAIYSRISIVSKMKFPLSIIPTYVILTQLYSHLILMLLIIILLFVIHGLNIFGVIGLIYYIITTTMFLTSISFITSTLSTIAKDFQIVIQSITRILFFLTPIMWILNEHTPDLLTNILTLNPFYYLIEGYRNCLLWSDLDGIIAISSLFHWLIIVILFIIGSQIHFRYRKNFADYS